MVAKSKPPVTLTTFFVTSPYQSKKKGNQNKLMEKGKKSKKHETLGRSSKRVATKRKVKRRTINCLFRNGVDIVHVLRNI